MPSPTRGVGAATIASSRMAEFKDWVAAERGVELPDYQALWAWSVDELDAFWAAIVDFFGVGLVSDSGAVLEDGGMPGAVWFPGAVLNFADEVFRRADPLRPAVVFTDESGTVTSWTWERLARDTQSLARWLEAQGVCQGDRVVGYLGNRPEALAALLACASIGAVWAVCNQDVSAGGAAARFAQLEPKVLLAAATSSYGGRRYEHSGAIDDLVVHLPTVRSVLIVDGQGREDLTGVGSNGSRESWECATATASPTERFVDVAFDHPLWVLFSSGTTGTPKGLVHGHGGTVLAQLAALGLHFDVRPGDRFFWFCSTSWVMWNLQVSSLLLGATAILYDGSPAFPDTDALWRIASELGVTHLGVSPQLLALAQDDELAPADEHDLGALRVLGVTGAPLPAATAVWARDGFRVPLNVISGGTDVATAFVGGNPLVPEPPHGSMGPPWLGVAAAAVNAVGETVTGEVGELVISKPMPSMPLHLWADPDLARYRETYFADFPGRWRQGDWVTFTRAAEGHCWVEVHGRSDATLNRNGIRVGTAEIYAAAEALPQVVEGLVVGVEQADGGYWMPMFVHLTEGCSLDDSLIAVLRAAIRRGASARHVPDDFIQVPALPHTLTGKRLEVPVKRLLMGHPVEDVVAPSAVDRPELLAVFTPALQAARSELR